MACVRSDSGKWGTGKTSGFYHILFFMARFLDMKVMCSLMFLILRVIWVSDQENVCICRRL